MSHPLSLKAVRHLRTLLSLILTNSEVRKLLSDFSVIGRDLLAKAATKAAEAIRPHEEAISHVDEPAPGGEFVTMEGQKIGTGETPVLDVEIPGSEVRVEQHPDADEPVVKGEAATGGRVLREGQQAARSAQELATDAGEQAAERVHHTTQMAKESVETQE